MSKEDTRSFIHSGHCPSSILGCRKADCTSGRDKGDTHTHTHPHPHTRTSSASELAIPRLTRDRSPRLAQRRVHFVLVNMGLTVATNTQTHCAMGKPQSWGHGDKLQGADGYPHQGHRVDHTFRAKQPLHLSQSPHSFHGENRQSTGSGPPHMWRLHSCRPRRHKEDVGMPWHDVQGAPKIQTLSSRAGDMKR